MWIGVWKILTHTMLMSWVWPNSLGNFFSAYVRISDMFCLFVCFSFYFVFFLYVQVVQVCDLFGVILSSCSRNVAMASLFNRRLVSTRILRNLDESGAVTSYWVPATISWEVS